jgi:FkbM family methyltransferase
MMIQAQLQKTSSLFQKLPHFKGKLRLAKLFYKKKINSKEEILFDCSKYELQFSAPNIVENVALELFIYGIYEEEVVNFFIKNIPQNGIFIDVGANIGAISVMIAKQRPDITIYAFEAAPFVYKYLKNNIEINNLKNVFCYNKAVHLENNIELPFYSPQDKNGKGSFSDVFTKDAVMVKTINLDNFFEENNIKPDAIKVDVEGYEKLIFQSMERSLKKLTEIFILFEFVDWAEELAQNCNIGDAQKILKEFQYNIVEMVDKKYFIKNEIQYSGSCKTMIATKHKTSKFI